MTRGARPDDVVDRSGQAPPLEERIRESRELLLRRQLSLQEQVGRLLEGRVLRQVVDRVAPIAELTRLAIDQADGRPVEVDAPQASADLHSFAHFHLLACPSPAVRARLRPSCHPAVACPIAASLARRPAVARADPDRSSDTGSRFVAHISDHRECQKAEPKETMPHLQQRDIPDGRAHTPPGTPDEFVRNRPDDWTAPQRTGSIPIGFWH